VFTSDFKMPLPPVKLEQALTDIIESIAMEDNALSSLIDSESEAVNNANKLGCDMCEFIALNESVNSLIKCVFRLQILLQFELEDACELLQRIENSDDDSVIDETEDRLDEIDESEELEE